MLFFEEVDDLGPAFYASAEQNLDCQNFDSEPDVPEDQLEALHRSHLLTDPNTQAAWADFEARSRVEMVADENTFRRSNKSSTPILNPDATTCGHNTTSQSQRSQDDSVLAQPQAISSAQVTLGECIPQPPAVPVAPLIPALFPGQGSFSSIPITDYNASVFPRDIPTPAPRQKPPKGPSPYDVAQQLLLHQTVLIINNAIYFYDGCIFRLLCREDMQRLIVACCRDVVKDAGDAGFVERIFKCLFNEPNICRNELQPSPDEVVLLDGVLNLRTGLLLPHSPDNFATSYLLADFTRGRLNSCPIFDNFIAVISDNDPVLATHIWEAIGYLLTQDQRGKCFILFQGPSNSGKSLLGNLIRSFINKEAVSSLDLHSFDKNFAMGDLVGKRLCLDLDLPAGAINPKAISILKKLTGGDLLTADIKYMPRINFVNSAKLLFASNHAVLSSGADDAFVQRMVVVPFRYSVPKEQQNAELFNQLSTERDAIVAKALYHYTQLRDRNYQFSGSYLPNKATDKNLDIFTCLLDFLDTTCIESEGACTSTEELWTAFLQRYPATCSKRFFSEQLNLILQSRSSLTEKGRKRLHGHKNPLSVFFNLGLLSNDHQEG